jgi:MFS family permease
VLLIFLKDKPNPPQERESIFKAYKDLGKGYKHYVQAAGIFSLAYFSFGFLLLKAYLVGFEIKDVVLLYALFNVAFVFVAAPIGKLGDLIGRRTIIASEYLVYFLMSIAFIFASTKWHIIWCFVLFGIFYAIDESQSKAYITDLEKTKRGTALGFYNFVTGLVYLPASLVAGYLWKISPSYAFLFAGIVSIVALVYFLVGQRSFAKKS